MSVTTFPGNLAINGFRHVGRPRKEPSQTVRMRVATAEKVEQLASLLKKEVPDLLDDLLLPLLDVKLHEVARRILDQSEPKKNKPKP